MPRGQISKSRLHPEKMHLISVCPCGRQYKGEVARAKKLFDLHKQVCPEATHESGIIEIAPVDSRGQLVHSSGKQQEKMLRAISSQVAQGCKLRINTGPEVERVIC
jgi:hypothetical protein